MPNELVNPRLPLLRGTFMKVVAVIYTAGCVFHVARLRLQLGWADMPFLPDWLLLFLGSWGAAGMIVFSGAVDYRGRWEVVTHWIIVLHLVVSVLLHLWILVVRSHEVLGIFSLEYSYFGLLYFGFFAWRSWTARLLPATPVAA